MIKIELILSEPCEFDENNTKLRFAIEHWHGKYMYEIILYKIGNFPQDILNLEIQRVEYYLTERCGI